MNNRRDDDTGLPPIDAQLPITPTMGRGRAVYLDQSPADVRAAVAALAQRLHDAAAHNALIVPMPTMANSEPSQVTAAAPDEARKEPIA